MKALRWIPLIFFVVLVIGFGLLSPRFLTIDNLSAILVQSSWLIVVALGMNLVLLTAGVDLSVGAVMYLAAITAAMALGGAPVWVAMLGAIAVGAAFGALNGAFIVRLGLPAFIVTLATTFIGRGIALFLSSTKIVYASPAVAEFGRASFLNIPIPVWLAALATFIAWMLLNRTALGPYIRSIGADPESARRVGVPSRAVMFCAYALCSAFAAWGGFISLSQTSAASGAFGQNSEFLAIAAAVLGGTSLFGGRGHVWAPIMGAVLITTVQNGLVMIDANPYAYPVITGLVIFIAALLDAWRSRMEGRLGRRKLRPVIAR